MASNLFEKYGIKEVADVTLYKIERKEELYESQRSIPISSVLKSALSVQTVYPLDDEGKGSEDGFEAYVFDEANVLTHYNYDCDDVVTINGVGKVIDLNNDGETAPIFDTDDTSSDDYAANWYSNPDNSYENFRTAYNGDYMNLISGWDSASLNDVSTKLPKWIANTDEFAINDLTIDNITLMNSENYNTVFNTTGILYEGPTVDIIATLNDAESEKYTNLPEEIKITVNLADVDNWKVIYGKVREYLAEYGIDMDESDIYGIYSTFKIDSESVSDATLKFSGGTITFKYMSPDIDTMVPLNVIMSVPATDDYYEVTIPETVLYDLQNGTNLSSNEDKVAAIKAIYQNITNLTIITIDGDPVTEDLDFDDPSIFSNIIFALNLFPYPVYQFKYTMTIESVSQAKTGIFDVSETDPDDSGHWVEDPDYRGAGTHEFSYCEQVCLLFAKNQNLITNRGTRYRFTHPRKMFTGISFNDDYAVAPNSTERVVVCGLAGKNSEGLYSIEEVNNYIKENLTDTISAKAYDITYSDYVELVVEDEMGYYMPEQLGVYSRKTKEMDFFDSTNTYKAWADARKGCDIGILNAVSTWGNDTHYSINDAIDALKQERVLLDGESLVVNTGFDRIFGGYKVKGLDADKDTMIHPDGSVGRPYDDGAGFYSYDVNGQPVKSALTGNTVYSGYSLDEVLTAISAMESYVEEAQLRVNNEVMQQSNRAIYVDATGTAASTHAYVYVMKNVNINTLSSDTQGIFEFYDKKGNKVSYQDKIFAGTAYLALVVIGQSGLVFVANRHCTKKTEKVAWMVDSGKGYLTDSQAANLVSRGLIHTVDITACDETFDATCTVSSLKIRKTKKNALHYTPVLFLDTLKISTIDQASESTDATGGRGNAKLMTWDYGKEITLSIEDALFSPASMSAIWGGTHDDLTNGVRDTKAIDRFEKIRAARNFIIPAGNSKGTPAEGDLTAQAVYYDPHTMQPFQDGTPIAEGEMIYKFTRSVAYAGESIGNTIEISADGFPGVYRVVGETYIRDHQTGEDQRFQFIIPEAKMMTDDTSITLESDGDPVVFDFTMNVLRPEDGVMMKFVQFDTVQNEEENDGSTMVKDTENLNLLDEAEMYKIGDTEEEDIVIGATEY